MIETSDTALLFVYGSLMSGCSQNALLSTVGEFVSEAKTERLFRLLSCGNYPAMVQGETGHSVEGEIWRIARSGFEILDDYEGSEYTRSRITVLTPVGTEEVEAYLWIAPFSGLNDIGSRWKEST